MSLAWLHTSKFPSNVGIVCASLLDISDGFGSENSANSLFIFRVILNDSISRERHPS
jgi:hypothetical protein